MEEKNGVQQTLEEGVIEEAACGDDKPKQLTAAQKKREKLKLKKKLAKEAADTDELGVEGDGNGEEGTAVSAVAKKSGSKGNDNNKGGKEVKGKTKGPSKAQIAAIQAAIQKAKEEEERLVKEEDEKQRQLEEAEQARQAKLKEEQEKKERKKQKEKDRKARLKEEGKLLTPRQKLERQRAQQLIESLKLQGAAIPGEIGGVEKKHPRMGTRLRPKKIQQQSSIDCLIEEIAANGNNDDSELQLSKVSLDNIQLEKGEGTKDSWDQVDGGEERKFTEKDRTDEEVIAYSEDDDGGGGDGLEDNSKESDENDNKKALNEKQNDGRNSPRDLSPRKKEPPSVRIERRRTENEKKKNLSNLRSPVVCVLGHVDTGKTKILDKLRRTHVQDGEAGGITQQIGATNVPIQAIKDSAKFVKGFSNFEIKVPGLLLIDTPGHESFSNLRSRGSSLCDIAILVVDIMHGLEPQTIESLNMLRKRKTPFVVALNKIDRIYDWKANAKRDVHDVIKDQSGNASSEFKTRANQVIVQFAQEGLNAALFFENPNPCEYISMVPTSALTGEGMGNLMALIVEYSQNMLAKRLMYSDELEATVMEVKAIPGLGTTIDVILVDGMLKEGDTLVLAGSDGPIVTQIRALLTPQPMKELRVKNTYIEYKEIKGAIGVKICAKDLESAIAGMNIHIAYHSDEVDHCREQVTNDLKTVLGSFRVQERGVYVQASTLGSLEALLEFLRACSIPYCGIRIGPVVKKDVMKASIMLEHDSQFAVILAFDVKIERDAHDLADHMGVKIFQADIIYHLFDRFTAYQDELKAKKREQFKAIAVFPCKLKILPQFIFNSRDPIVIGVSVEAGNVRIGTPLCVPTKECLEIGRVTSIEINHKQVDQATKGQDVCIKIEPLPGDSPKMLGRHFELTDLLVSKITRESIDACKEYFRNDLQKSDWQLFIELKKVFQIM